MSFSLASQRALGRSAAPAVAGRPISAPKALAGTRLAQRSQVRRSGRFVAAQANRTPPSPTPTEGESVDVDAIVKDLQDKWDKVENKTTVGIYAGGSLVALWLSSTIVGAVNAVPLLPKFLELVGLGYTAWFVYRYLLFKSSREELLEDVEELKKKISGSAEKTLNN